MADPRLIRAVTEALADLGGAARTLLDVSCKTGDVLKALEPLGFDRRGTNFVYQGEDIGVPVDLGVDLTKRLPYADGSFDVVTLIEVIEHVENHRAAIGELARVVKPGGVLLLTTPNIMRLSSRFHFFFSGFHKTKRDFVRFETPLAEAHWHHVYPIDLPTLWYFAHQNALELERAGKIRVKPFNRILLPLVYPILVPYTLFFFLVREKDEAQKREYRKLARFLLHPRILLEDNLILRFRKKE
ncbi:MAG: class I SAM-dependent methyltransferase [Candidatus Binatia bacterium]